jgi:hypothetical protein
MLLVSYTSTVIAERLQGYFVLIRLDIFPTLILYTLQLVFQVES